MIKFKLHDERAVLPSKAHAADSGYDLTAIEIHSKPTQLDSVILLETGVSVQPPEGYYFEVVARSSLMKKGYCLANSVGIIDAGYRDTIKVAVTPLPMHQGLLYRIGEHLPLRGFQLILRKLHSFPSCQVDELDETARGTGGFGSTG